MDHQYSANVAHTPRKGFSVLFSCISPNNCLPTGSLYYTFFPSLIDTLPFVNQLSILVQPVLSFFKKQMSGEQKSPSPDDETDENLCQVSAEPETENSVVVPGIEIERKW